MEDDAALKYREQDEEERDVAFTSDAEDEKRRFPNHCFEFCNRCLRILQAYQILHSHDHLELDKQCLAFLRKSVIWDR